MTVVRITQVTFTEEGVFVGGEPEDDSTKVLIGALGDPVAALQLAFAVAAGAQPVTDMPDDVIVRIVEKPLNDL